MDPEKLRQQITLLEGQLAAAVGEYEKASHIADFRVRSQRQHEVRQIQEQLESDLEEATTKLRQALCQHEYIDWSATDEVGLYCTKCGYGI